MSNIVKELFQEWKLDTWANVLEVVGFIFGIVSLVITILVKSKVDRLRADHQFDRRANQHLVELNKHASSFNNLLNHYNTSTNELKVELAKCQSELEDLNEKLHSKDSKKIRRLRNFIKRKKNKPFIATANYSKVLQFFQYVGQYFITTENDIWSVYSRLAEVIRQVENIKKNRKTSL